MKNIWCIVPFSKPDCKNLVLENFNRQKYKNKRLCIVENGQGIGLFNKNDCDLLLKSEPHQSKAKNLALDKLNKEWAFSTFDCDDYYGPKYLDEIVDALKIRKITGKLRHFINMNDGKIYLVDEENANKQTSWIHGATLSAHLNLKARFPIVDIDEEGGFIKQTKLKTYSLSIYNYMYNRSRNDHLYKISKDGFLLTAGKRKEFKYNLNVVNGKKIKPVKIIEDPISYFNTTNLVF